VPLPLEQRGVLRDDGAAQARPGAQVVGEQLGAGAQPGRDDVERRGVGGSRD